MLDTERPHWQRVATRLRAILMSKWTLYALTIAMAGATTLAVHDERPSTTSEALSVYSLLAACGAWWVAKGVQVLRGAPDRNVSKPRPSR